MVPGTTKIEPQNLSGDDDDVRLLLQRERFQDDALRLHGQDQGWQGLQPGGNELLHD